MSIYDTWVNSLSAVVERVEELIDAAVADGERAIEHKLSEALGPLSSALQAAEQHRDGLGD